MAKKSKRLRKSVEGIDRNSFYPLEEAISMIKGRAGAKFELLATNELDGSYTLSSPSIAGGRLYVRTERFLYCIGAK